MKCFESCKNIQSRDIEVRDVILFTTRDAQENPLLTTPSAFITFSGINLTLAPNSKEDDILTFQHYKFAHHKFIPKVKIQPEEKDVDNFFQHFTLAVNQPNEELATKVQVKHTCN